MYTRPIEPRSIGGVLDDGLRLWRDSIPKTWPLALIAQLIVVLPFVFLAYKFPGLIPTGMPRMSAAGAGAANVQAALALFMSPVTWLTYLVILILSAACYAAIILRIAAVADDAVLSLGGSVTAALRRLPRLVVQFLLFMLVLFGAVLAVGIVAGFAGAASGSGRATSVLLGVVLFFAFFFVFGRVFFASIILITDNAGPAESIAISWRLTRGYWWRCAAMLTVVFIIALVFSLVASLLTVWIAAAVGPGTLLAAVLGQGLGVLVNALLGSLFPAVLIAILDDLKLRKRGGDLSNRVDALARQ
jgi:hypothetical protein